MKAYTDIEQSRKLAEILPLESADMMWEQHYNNQPYVTIKPHTTIGKSINCHCCNCWSLAALLDVLPSVIKRNGKRMFLTLEKAGAYNLYYKSPDRLDELWETKEDVVDACVAMIEDLHEQKPL